MTYKFLFNYLDPEKENVEIMIENKMITFSLDRYRDNSLINGLRLIEQTNDITEGEGLDIIVDLLSKLETEPCTLTVDVIYLDKLYNIVSFNPTNFTYVIKSSSDIDNILYLFEKELEIK